MKRAIWIIVLALVAFAAIILVRLPASWVVPAPPAAISCAGADGTIWSGTCAGLTVRGVSFGDLTWELHPSRLLSGKLAAHVVLTRGTHSVQGEFETGLDKNLTARDVRADLPLDPTLFPQLQKVRGSAHAELARLGVNAKGIITDLQGRIDLHDLEEASGQVTRLGSYTVTFPGGTGEPAGQFHDLGDGPVSVEGTLRVTREPGFEIEGLVKAQPNAPAELVSELRYLGSPDAQGRRQFSFANSF